MDDVAEVRPVPGYEGHYEVDSLGNVFSLKRGRRMQMRSSKSSRGYLQVQLFTQGQFKTIQVHVLVAMAFLDHTRCGHEIEVDHIDQNRLNNKKSNLRTVVQPLNALNRKVQDRNQSGVTGVIWSKWVKKWIASIRVDWKLIHLGCFVDVDEAIEARRGAENLRIDELLIFRESLRSKNLKKNVDLSTY